MNNYEPYNYGLSDCMNELNTRSYIIINNMEFKGQLILAHEWEMSIDCYQSWCLLEDSTACEEREEAEGGW